MTLSKTTAKQASELVLEMRRLLPRGLQGGGVDPPSALTFKLLSLRETLLFRIADLSDAALSLISKHGTGAAILARSVMETTAVLVALRDLVVGVNASGSASGFNEDVTKLLFGSRREGAPVVVTNILTQIGRLDKMFKDHLQGRLRSMYDNLSEIAHPNASGVIVSYGGFDRDTFSLTFAKKDSENGEIAVLSLCACLKISLQVHLELENMLNRFQEVCRGLNVQGA